MTPVTTTLPAAIAVEVKPSAASTAAPVAANAVEVTAAVETNESQQKALEAAVEAKARQKQLLKELGDKVAPSSPKKAEAKVEAVDSTYDAELASALAASLEASKDNKASVPSASTPAPKADKPNQENQPASSEDDAALAAALQASENAPAPASSSSASSSTALQPTTNEAWINTPLDLPTDFISKPIIQGLSNWFVKKYSAKMSHALKEFAGSLDVYQLTTYGDLEKRVLPLIEAAGSTADKRTYSHNELKNTLKEMAQTGVLRFAMKKLFGG